MKYVNVFIFFYYCSSNALLLNAGNRSEFKSYLFAHPQETYAELIVKKIDSEKIQLSETIELFKDFNQVDQKINLLSKLWKEKGFSLESIEYLFEWFKKLLVENKINHTQSESIQNFICFISNLHSELDTNYHFQSLSCSISHLKVSQFSNTIEDFDYIVIGSKVLPINSTLNIPISTLNSSFYLVSNKYKEQKIEITKDNLSQISIKKIPIVEGHCDSYKTDTEVEEADIFFDQNCIKKQTSLFQKNTGSVSWIKNNWYWLLIGAVAIQQASQYEIIPP